MKYISNKKYFKINIQTKTKLQIKLFTALLSVTS